jgi:hypothetical protein
VADDAATATGRTVANNKRASVTAFEETVIPPAKKSKFFRPFFDEEDPRVDMDKDGDSGQSASSNGVRNPLASSDDLFIRGAFSDFPH